MSLAIIKLKILKESIEYKAIQAKMTGCILREQDDILKKNAEKLLNRIHS